MNVAICIPSRDTVSAGFAKSLANLTSRLTSSGIKFEVLMVLGTVIPQLRTDLADMALKKQYEWLLWLDSDMHFPNYTFDRLLSHNQKVVAATYSTRYKPQRSVAFLDHNDYNQRLTAVKGLHQVSAVGMGCMLTHRSVFETLPKPWFSHEWDKLTESYMGEDIFFSKLLKNFNYDIYVDIDLSKEVGHYGTKIFLLQETSEFRV
jgi:hypothetical protein